MSEFRFKFYWSLFLRVHLILRHNWFIFCWAPSHYLNQWWHSLLARILKKCVRALANPYVNLKCNTYVDVKILSYMYIYMYICTYIHMHILIHMFGFQHWYKLWIKRTVKSGSKTMLTASMDLELVHSMVGKNVCKCTVVLHKYPWEASL